MMSRLLTGLVLQQGMGSLSRFGESQSKYAMAQEEARIRDKPLMVVGGPSGTADPYTKQPWIYGFLSVKHFFNIKAHGCGDLCVDIDPKSCEGCEYEQADITDLPFADNEFGAVFVGHIFRHLHGDDKDMAWQEVSRVADSVYYTNQSRFWLLGYIAPGL